MEEVAKQMREVRCDPGPVLSAVQCLIENSTLRMYAEVEPPSTFRGRVNTRSVRMSQQDYDMCGTGTKLLWDLVESMTGSGATVSFYKVIGHLDQSNKNAVLLAMQTYLRVI